MNNLKTHSVLIYDHSIKSINQPQSSILTYKITVHSFYLTKFFQVNSSGTIDGLSLLIYYSYILQCLIKQTDLVTWFAAVVVICRTQCNQQ